MGKVVAFCIADNNNLKYYEMMKNSLRKFYSEEELPLILIDEAKIQTYRDPDFFYRATPIIAKELLEEYETVVKIDADSIITGKLNFEGDYDVAVVNNSNPAEMKAYPYQLLNIHPLSYVNCGFVIMKSKEFVNFWYNFCYSILFPNFQMREQDLLNILIASNNYNVFRLDEGDSFYGLASKGYWTRIELRGDQLILPKGEQWPNKDKIIRVIHWAGGNTPDKMKIKLHFQPEVIKKLEALIEG